MTELNEIIYDKKNDKWIVAKNGTAVREFENYSHALEFSKEKSNELLY